MSGILFHQIIFGPIHSRRLGRSLGINLLPEKIKLCTFNCIYCECGWAKTDKILYSEFLPSELIIAELEKHFAELSQKGEQIDSITYSGNGEPTLHPSFATINNAIINLRNRYFPKTIISCLSNSTQLFREDVLLSLQKIENPLMKLDAGTQSTFNAMNKPFESVSIEDITNWLCRFNGNLTIQTLFVRGKLDDETIVDNTTEQEISTWLERIKKINPHSVMLYPIDRETPARNLQKLDKKELEQIAQQIEQLGIKALVY